MSYAETIGAVDFPVMADGSSALAGVTPMTEEYHPEVCSVADDMTILACYRGHGSYLDALDDIRAHAGL